MQPRSGGASVQRKSLAKKGYEVIREFVDEAESSRTANRPAFQEMISLARSKNSSFDVVLVWKLSRFARNREDSIVYKSLLRKRGIQVVSINEHVDDTPAGTLLEGIIESIDEFYSANLGQDTKRGMRENVSRGYYNGGSPAIGYKVNRVRVGNATKNVLVLDDEYAPIVRRVFVMALSGKGAKEIVNILNRESIKTNRGKPWSKEGVLYILRNEVYAGTLVCGKEDKGMEPVRKLENHPAIVTGAEFKNGQIQITERSPVNCRPRSLTSPYLLSGLIFCGKCGCALQSCSAKSERLHYYFCHNSMRKGKVVCKTKLVNRDRIEKEVIQRLKRHVITEENLRELLRLTNLELEQSQGSVKNQIGVLDKEIAKRQRKLDNLYRVPETGKIDIDDIAPRIKELRTSIEQCRGEQLGLAQKLHAPLKPLSKAQLRLTSRIYRVFSLKDRCLNKRAFSSPSLSESRSRMTASW
jgi:site-specific DNA recombinase